MFARAVATGLIAGILILFIIALLLSSVVYLEISLEFAPLLYHFLWGLTVFIASAIAAYIAKQRKMLAGITTSIAFLLVMFLVKWLIFPVMPLETAAGTKAGEAVLGGVLGSLLGALFNSRHF